MERNIFSQRLSMALEYRNISQAELCKAAGLNTSTVSRYVNGKTKGKPQHQNVSKIALVLRCSSDWLSGNIDDPGYYDEAQALRFVKPEQISINTSLAYSEIRKRQKQLFIQEGLEDTKANGLVALLDTLKKIPGDYYQEVQNYAKYIATTSQKESESEDNQ